MNPIAHPLLFSFILQANFFRSLVLFFELFSYVYIYCLIYFLLLFFENFKNFFMFRDVPGCSGMFHVPGFIDAPPFGLALEMN